MRFSVNLCHRLLVSVPALAIGLSAPTAALAYCVFPDFDALWMSSFADLRIPVFLSTGTNSAIDFAGFSFEQAERVLIEEIGRHNEVSAGPTLYYAGPTDTDVNYQDPNGGDSEQAHTARPLGITVDSYDCGQAAFGNICIGANSLACASGPGNLAKRRVTIKPPSCPAFPDADQSSLIDFGGPGPDLGIVVLHELGHALGLDHTDITQQECTSNPFRAHGNNVDV